MKKYFYNKNFCEDIDEDKKNDNKNNDAKNLGEQIHINTKKNELIVEL